VSELSNSNREEKAEGEGEAAGAEVAEVTVKCNGYNNLANLCTHCTSRNSDTVYI